MHESDSTIEKSLQGKAGDIIKSKLMIQAGIRSNYKLAELLGVEKSTLSNWKTRGVNTNTIVEYWFTTLDTENHFSLDALFNPSCDLTRFKLLSDVSRWILDSPDEDVQKLLNILQLSEIPKSGEPQSVNDSTNNTIFINLNPGDSKTVQIVISNGKSNEN